MRILIADDQTSRYRNVIAKIKDLGIDRKNIDLVGSANEARDKLVQGSYDLFILDILLPLWTEDEGDTGQHSNDILLELFKTEEFKKPIKVIGITGDKTTVQSELKIFEKHLLPVIEYDASSSVWEDQLVESVAYIKSLKLELLRPNIELERVDLVVVCALNDPELAEVLKLPWEWSVPETLNEKVFFSRGKFKSKERIFTVVAAHAERMGMVHSALLCTTLINEFNPKVITMTGICAGIEGKVNLGDIIFAELVWDYQNGKRIESGELEFEPYQMVAAQCVKASALQLSKSKQFFRSLSLDYTEKEISSIPKLYIGPVAVGSSVLADRQAVEDIVKQNRKVLGIEMETFGLYTAAYNAKYPSPKVFALKSVCDFANSKKDDDFQSYAAFTSAKTLKELVENYGFGFIN